MAAFMSNPSSQPTSTPLTSRNMRITSYQNLVSAFEDKARQKVPVFQKKKKKSEATCQHTSSIVFQFPKLLRLIYGTHAKLLLILFKVTTREN